MDFKQEGLKLYNSLREFYDEPDRRDFLDYIIRYSEIEAEFLDVEYEILAPFRGFMMLEELYDRNVRHLHCGGKEAVPLEILTEGEIRHELRKKHGEIPQK